MYVFLLTWQEPGAIAMKNFMWSAKFLLFPNTSLAGESSLQDNNLSQNICHLMILEQNFIFQLSIVLKEVAK